MKRWKWIRHDGDVLLDVGINDDGTLWNPHGEPEATVRAAIAAAEERDRHRRSKAARKAAETRRKRQERQVYKVAHEIVDGHRFGPASHCVICKRGLDDPQSIERGIGSDCWQDVLAAIAA